MDINSVNSYASTVASATANTSKSAAKSSQQKDSADSTGVIYEKSSSKTSANKRTDNSAIVAKMKADADSRVSQLRGIVEQMMTKQGSAIGKADSMWSFLAGGNFTVSGDVKAQAQKDIADDGYWGVNQTSERIVDFAKALSGADKSKAEELMNAFKKGFSEATKSWGKSLPDISQKTYDATIEKFNTWMNGDN